MSRPGERGATVVLCGNPRPASRTLAVGLAVAAEARPAGPEPIVIDLAAAELDRAAALRQVHDAALLVVATPTYKASFTGVLKLFLDEIAGGALTGVVAIPVMTAGDARHALAVEVHLRPVLVELGASCPTAGVAVTGEAIDDPGPALVRWAEAARPLLGRLLDER